MIHTKRTVTVGKQESIIDAPIILYRGDREVEVEFTLVGNKYTFSSGGNVIESANATHGQLVLNTPSGENMFSEVTECDNGKVVFVITKEMIDELIEVGFYSFQIRLYDSEELVSRVTIPPVQQGFDIRNPIAAEDETNVVDQALVDYSRIYKDQLDEEIHTFDWDGNYNKTEWEHHDIISANKLNKIEDALYTINEGLDEGNNKLLQKTNNMEKEFQNKVDELKGADKQLGDEIDDVNRTINNRIDKLEVDVNVGDVAWKNEVENSFVNLVATTINYIRFNTKDELQNIFCSDVSNSTLIFNPDEQVSINSTISILNIKNLNIEGLNVKGAIIYISHDSDNITFKNCKFEGGSQVIYLGDCNNITVENCYFYKCGYQILQEMGHVSNNIRIINNTSVDCSNDFVELNCEHNAYSTNVLISGNIVKNVGSSKDLAETESRFVGITLCNHVIISNNVFDTCAGDAPIHIERNVDVKLVNNTIINGHGHGARGIVIYKDNDSAGLYSEPKFLIDGNTFLYYDNDFSNDATYIIGDYSETFSNAVIVNNRFIAVDPSTYPNRNEDYRRNMVGIYRGYCHGNWTIEKNEFRQLDTAARIEKSIGGSGSVVQPSVIFDKNLLNRCTNGVISGSDDKFLSVCKNTFEFVDIPFSFTTYPFSIGENKFRGTNVTNYIVTNGYRPDDYSTDATTDCAFREFVCTTGPDGTVSVKLGLFNIISTFISIIIGDKYNMNTHTKELFYITHRGDCVYNIVSIAKPVNGSVSISLSSTPQSDYKYGTITATFNRSVANVELYVRVNKI